MIGAQNNIPFQDPRDIKPIQKADARSNLLLYTEIVVKPAHLYTQVFYRSPFLGFQGESQAIDFPRKYGDFLPVLTTEQ